MILVQAMAIGLSQERYVDVLSRAGLPIRWRAICVPLTLDESCQTPRAFRPSNSLTSNGIKWIADGTDIERFGESLTRTPGLSARLFTPGEASRPLATPSRAP